MASAETVSRAGVLLESAETDNHFPPDVGTMLHVKETGAPLLVTSIVMGVEDRCPGFKVKLLSDCFC